MSRSRPAGHQRDSEVPPEQQRVELALLLAGPLEVRLGDEDGEGRAGAEEEADQQRQRGRLEPAAEGRAVRRPHERSRARRRSRRARSSRTSGAARGAKASRSRITQPAAARIASGRIASEVGVRELDERLRASRRAARDLLGDDRFPEGLRRRRAAGRGRRWAGRRSRPSGRRGPRRRRTRSGGCP